MTSSLVGSEMCIRDSERSQRQTTAARCEQVMDSCEYNWEDTSLGMNWSCLLYTSDAADDM
eukprot:3596780-Prorocentrum_lima.AAC.1